MRASFSLLTGIGAVLAVAGCASAGGFPSLAPRAAEGDLSPEEPLHPAPEVPADAAMRARIAELRGQAAAGDRAFAAAHGPAETAVEAAGPPQSERWIEAQQAISRLEAAREATMRALGELDRLAIGRADMPTSAEDFAAINEALAAVERMAMGQQQRLDRLREQLSGR